MSGTHSPYGFSGIERIVKCPGSRSLCERYPQDENTIPSMEGTAAHWAWLQLLQGKQIDVGMFAPNGIPLTVDMCDGADLFADTVRSVIPANAIHAEELIVCSEMSPKNWGTPDVFGVQPEIKRIDVMEYKYGHRYVEVFENWQMVNATLAIMEMLQLNGQQEQEWRVVFHVVQPRSFHQDGVVRTWSCWAADLRRQRNIIQSAIPLAERENAACFTGSYCMDCSGRARCPTLQRHSYATIELSVQASPVELPPPALGVELRIMKTAKAILDARVDGLEEQALASIRKGEHVPGFKSESSSGRLNWTKPVPEVLAMADMMKIDVRNDKKAIITPTQAIQKGLSEAVVNGYATRQKGELKLIIDDGTAARKAFFSTDKKG